MPASELNVIRADARAFSPGRFPLRLTMSAGEVAGTAAALSVRQNKKVKDVQWTGPAL